MKAKRTYTLTEPNFSPLVMEKDARFEDNYATQWIQKHMDFWRSEGAFIFASNLSKGYGDVESRKRLLGQTFPEFLLDVIHDDVEASLRLFFRETEREWTAIRTYSHVAVHNEYNERVFLIRFNHEAYESL